MIAIALRHHSRLRRLSLWLGIIGFACFAQGLYAAAMWIRIATELTRLPSFYRTKMRDQVALSWVILGGCLYGLIRLNL